MAIPAPHSNREIQVFPDVNEIASRAAELILAAANAAVEQNGRFTIAPHWTTTSISRAKAWLAGHGHQFAVRGLAAVGGLLVVKGLIQLLS